MRLIKAIPVLLAIALAVGCGSAHYIAQFDQGMVDQVSGIQDSLISYSGARAQGQAFRASFYPSIKTKLAVAYTRAQATPLDSLVAQDLENIQHSVALYHTLDSVVVDSAYHAGWAATFTAECQSTLKLLIAEKRQ